MSNNFLHEAHYPSRFKYIVAHPNSDLGDPNAADSLGYELVTFLPNADAGLYLYRRKEKFMSIGKMITLAIIVLVFSPIALAVLWWAGIFALMFHAMSV
jgi:hypothetical protein